MTDQTGTTHMNMTLQQNSSPSGFPSLSLTKVGTNAKRSKNTRVNPKRLARQASKEIAQRGLTSHAQEAIKLDLESRKLQRKVHDRQQILEENERKYQLRVQKAKKKHRGK
ncbi:DUF2992 family protein [Paenibacillus illinoisensis]|uniref:DUF2992 family protein n=1 Tax=Paenibacillus illinoisensis TaxID=59845 RepID=A0ABW8HWG8_9BACL